MYKSGWYYYCTYCRKILYAAKTEKIYLNEYYVATYIPFFQGINYLQINHIAEILSLYMYVCMYMYINTYIYRVSQEERT